jgi:hypothetical protein
MDHTKLKYEGFDRHMFRFCSFIEWKTGIRKIMSVSELVAKQYTGIFIKSYRYLID